jgi:lipopolysaccharide export system permease protein
VQLPALPAIRILDRYVMTQFMRIFAACVLGVPLLFTVIDLVDNLDVYLGRGLSRLDVLLHYVFEFPNQTLLAFPLASFLAAVFTISTLSRHFEVTAAKASGISFYRVAMPMFALAMLLSFVALGLTEIVPVTTRRAGEVIGDHQSRAENTRRNFVFRGNAGLVYRVERLDARTGKIEDLEISREGTGFSYPTYVITAKEASWDSARSLWKLQEGRMRFFGGPATERSFLFDEFWQPDFREQPQELLADPKDPDEMRYGELGRFIDAIQRSGGTARELIVERALKISYPFTCFIIVLFGIPLAQTTRRGGAPVSLGIALGTTILFLMLVRIAQALGAGGVVAPSVAAWLPNFLFLAAGLVLLARVRT